MEKEQPFLCRDRELTPAMVLAVGLMDTEMRDSRYWYCHRYYQDEYGYHCFELRRFA